MFDSVTLFSYVDNCTRSFSYTAIGEYAASKLTHADLQGAAHFMEFVRTADGICGEPSRIKASTYQEVVPSTVGFKLVRSGAGSAKGKTQLTPLLIDLN